MCERRAQALNSISQFNKQLSAQRQTLTLDFTDPNTNVSSYHTFQL